MSIVFRKVSIDHIDIDEFRHFFIHNGRKAIERTYGRSNDVLMQLIAKGGGPALLAERRAVQRTGRKAGGRHAPYSPQEGRTDAIAVSEASEGFGGMKRAHGACGADLERV